MNSKWPFRTTGIPDEMFIRGNIPMTKKEVRVISLAQARIQPSSIIYDIGAGTGSFSIEAALRAEQGKVFSIEKENEGVELIKANRDQFTLNNIEVIHGTAPEALEGLPKPDIIFLGGSGGNLKAILDRIDEMLPKGGRFIANAIVIENVNTIFHHIKSGCYEDIEYIQATVAKTVLVGEQNMLKSHNPVCIISGQRI